MSLTLAVVFGLPPGLARAQEPFPADVTLAGTVPGVPGATISITLTEDGTGVVRLDADGLLGMPAGIDLSERYFYPPSPITDFSFHVSTGQYFGMARTAAVIEGTLAGEDEITGTVEIIGCVFPGGCFTLGGPYDFTLAGPVDTPPAPEDVIYSGGFEGAPGSISIALAPDGFTATVISGVDLTACVEETEFALRTMHTPAVPLDGGASMVVAGPAYLWFTRVEVAAESDGLSGTFSWREGPYIGDCAIDLHWTAAPPVTATATVEPTAAPTATSVAQGLPATGGGDGRPRAAPLAALGALTAAVGFGALALGRLLRLPRET